MSCAVAHSHITFRTIFFSLSFRVIENIWTKNVPPHRNWLNWVNWHKQTIWYTWYHICIFMYWCIVCCSMYIVRKMLGILWMRFVYRKVAYAYIINLLCHWYQGSNLWLNFRVDFMRSVCIFLSVVIFCGGITQDFHKNESHRIWTKSCCPDWHAEYMRNPNCCTNTVKSLQKKHLIFVKMFSSIQFIRNANIWLFHCFPRNAFLYTH